jgi:hypothetical protein
MPGIESFVFPQVALEVYRVAVCHGWKHDDHAQKIALMHSELSEALESWRNHEEPYHLMLSADFEDATIKLARKPVGWAVELIDCCIRILDFFGYLLNEKIIKNARNTTDTGRFREIYDKIKDGADLPWLITICHKYISTSFDIGFGIAGDSRYLYDAFSFIITYLESRDIDWKKIMSEKIEYNRQRPYRHGGKKC